MSTETIQVRRPIYGYVRALPELHITEVLRLSRELHVFAEREGFTLAEVFIERKWLHSVAWDALVTNCQRHSVRNVVVPSSDHLHTLPALS
ncbi:hypothetical protein [Streptomyces broussonetiae]|uniref:Resolvase/invertase-type recombinase catalytic domain-containing protein n=1 Tax=Streptomyces broussonetiae TaxID=2686304 RepID=A0ABV5EK19_9ACTN